MITGSFVNANSFGAGGPKPTLLLDFTTGNLDSRITFSRGSHATYFRSDGVLDWAPNNVIRNNTMVGAIAGTPGTSPTNWSISPSVGLSYKIEAVGVENGISYIDLKISGTANAATTLGGIFFPDSLTLVPASSGQTWTTSCYFKLVAGNFNNVTTLYWNCVERNNAGSSNGLTSSSNLTSVTSAALDTQRYSVSRTFTNATTVYTMSSLTLGCSINAVIDFTIRVGMPQLELGSTATTVNATSGTAYYGPRFDYDPNNVLRQNLFTYSEQLDNAIWFKPTTTLNYLTYSEEFDNAVWRVGNTGTVTANAAVAPFGSASTADLITAGNVLYGGLVARRFNNPVYSANTQYTLSVYAKAGTHQYLGLRAGGDCVASGANSGNYAYFNLSTGIATTITPQAGTINSVNMESIGSGWYRCSITYTTPAVPINSVSYTDIAIVSSTGQTAVTPAGTENLYIWGAQLEISSSAGPYISTTTTAATAPSIIVQTNQIRNNTMVGAAAGTPGTLPTNWGTDLAGTTREIVGSGTVNGITYVDIRFSGTPTSTTDIAVYPESTTGIAAKNGQSWAISAWVSIVAGSLSNIISARLRVDQFNSAATFLSVLGAKTISLTSSLTRFTGVITTNNVFTAYVRPGVGLSVTSGQAIDITLRIGLPQMVQGSLPGDVVATSTAAKPTLYTDPLGGTTAQALFPTVVGGNNGRIVFTSFAGPFPFNTPITFSCYVKLPSETTSTGVVLQIECPIDGVYAGANTVVTLTGTPSFTVGGYDVSSPSRVTNRWGTLTNVGNDWYRCSITWVFTGTDPPTQIDCNVWPYLAGNATNSSVALIWGAQLQVGRTTVDQYITTTSSIFAEYGPNGLLVEGARTNFIRNNTMQGAVAGTPGTAPTGWLYPSYAGITRQIIKTGTENGINYIDIRWSGAPTSFLDGQTLVGFIGINVQTAPIGQTWNGSCYCRLIGGSFNNFDVLELGLEEWSSVGDFNGGNYETIKTANSNPLVQQRFSESRTIQTSTTLYVSSRIDCRVQAAAPIDITLRIGMPQLEAYNIGTGTASATVVSGGSGYQVGDVLEVVGGVSGTKTRLTVATLSGSAVATVTVSTAGTYFTWPTLPASVTPITGTGTSATFNLVPQQRTATTTYPIPTYGTIVTQAKDVAVVTTLTPWFNAVEGTLFCEGRTFNGTQFDYPRFAALTDDQGQVETIHLLLDGPSNQMQGAIWDNGVAQGTANSANNPRTQFVKGAVAYKLNDSLFAFDGATPVADNVCTIPTVTKLTIGTDGTTGGQISGWIKRVIYYARRLLASELKIITT